MESINLMEVTAILNGRVSFYTFMVHDRATLHSQAGSYSLNIRKCSTVKEPVPERRLNNSQTITQQKEKTCSVAKKKKKNKLL